MAVLLNNLFFPQTDPWMTTILSAFAFCSTYILRPFASLLFGYIGDKYGRRPTLVITMLMMAFSCMIMMFVPTYSEWGIASTIIVTFCRVLQGMSSLGEIVGAELYLMETTKPPVQYTAVGLLTVSSSLGSLLALAIASLATLSSSSNWRFAFVIGLGIAFIGSASRMWLRETPEFTDMSLRLKMAIKKGDEAEISKIQLRKNKDVEVTPTQNKITVLMYMLLQCPWPMCFYFSYIYCGDILKTFCGYSPADIIHQNLIVSVVQLIAYATWAQLSYYIFPLKIIKFKLALFSLAIFLFPFILENVISGGHSSILGISSLSMQVFIVQCSAIILAPHIASANPIFFSYFPILKRFTYASFPYAVSRAFMYPIVSFGLVGTIAALGVYWGLMIMFLPVAIFFSIGLNHFVRLEKEYGNHR